MLDSETRAMFMGLAWERKPSKWDHIGTSINISEIPAEVPRFDAADLGVWASPMCDFRLPVEGQFLVIYRGGKVFFVNTEGSNYCRYVVGVRGDDRELVLGQCPECLQINRHEPGCSRGR